MGGRYGGRERCDVVEKGVWRWGNSAPALGTAITHLIITDEFEGNEWHGNPPYEKVFRGSRVDLEIEVEVFPVLGKLFNGRDSAIRTRRKGGRG